MIFRYSDPFLPSWDAKAVKPMGRKLKKTYFSRRPLEQSVPAEKTTSEYQVTFDGFLHGFYFI